VKPVCHGLDIVRSTSPAITAGKLVTMNNAKKSKVLATAAAVISLLRSSVSNLHAFLQFA